jgi:hypothetical protein
MYREYYQPVIAGLDPAIHDGLPHEKPYNNSAGYIGVMDARVKPAHDRGRRGRRK